MTTAEHPEPEPRPLTWDDHQAWERDWWSDCANTFAEENKQITYAHRMGLVNQPNPISGAWPSYDLQGRSVLDIGGGPVSLLLKCRNRGDCVTTDPCHYPHWIDARYDAAGILSAHDPGEDIGEYRRFDEVWIYNVLQHTRDPELIVANARALALVVRVFEWVDQGTSIGHPQNLTADQLDKWFDGRGTVEQVNENGCVGRAWYGVFS